LIKDIQTELSLRYARIKNKNGHGNDKESSMEQALVAFQCFKGKCRKCGRIGHKAANCQSGGAGRARQNDNNNNVQDGNDGGADQDVYHKHLQRENQCFYCKKRGHIVKYCRAKQQGQNGMNRSEATNTAVNMDNVVFMAVEGHKKKLTEDTWIADLGATCHITNSMEGMFDIEDV